MKADPAASLVKREQLYRQYRDELLNNVEPFWRKHCPDNECGGYFTCLDRDGSVYDTEKFMWVQWRIVWMFCELHQKVERKAEWLDIAKAGYDFLTSHGKDQLGRYYFSLARDGTPATAPYSVYSDCFAAMGSAALYRATGNAGAKNEALKACAQYQSRRDNPKGEWEKGMSGRGQYVSISYYMMQVVMGTTLTECLEDESFLPDVRDAFMVVLDRFWNEEMGVFFENVPAAGGFDLDSMTGRHNNPGHAIETMWFLLDAAERIGCADSIPRIREMLLATLKRGWDPLHGGIFYFMDACNRPHLELQWDMKLWWVHNEALIATLMAFAKTGDRQFADWFERIHDWTWSHFPDPEYGEWFGYLNRQGEPTHQLKGGKWKTFFHLPRALSMCSELLSSS